MTEREARLTAERRTHDLPAPDVDGVAQKLERKITQARHNASVLSRGDSLQQMLGEHSEGEAGLFEETAALIRSQAEEIAALRGENEKLRAGLTAAYAQGAADTFELDTLRGKLSAAETEASNLRLKLEEAEAALLAKAQEARKLAADLSAQPARAHLADPSLQRMAFAMGAKCDHFLEAAQIVSHTLTLAAIRKDPSHG